MVCQTNNNNNNQVRILKASRDLQALDPDSEDIYMNRRLQRYAARHSSLNSVCLADCAVDCDVDYRNRQHDDTDNDILSSQPSTVCDTSAVITLNDGLGKMC